MIIVATFRCGALCPAKVDTVAVNAPAADVEEVVAKLSLHSCYYQGHAKGYAYDDLAVFDGRLVHCELLPESTDEVRLLTPQQFRQLWDRRDRLHREVEEELRTEHAQDASGHDKKRSHDSATPESCSLAPNGAERRVPRRVTCVPAGSPSTLYALATFTDGGRSETKESTVLVSLDVAETSQLVRMLSLHSCYWQSHATGYEDLVIAEGRLVRCELTPIDEEVRLLTTDEFRALWEREEQGIREAREEMEQRRRMRAETAIRYDASGGAIDTRCNPVQS